MKKKNPNQKQKPKYQPKTCKTKEGQRTSKLTVTSHVL